ncbi:ribonuclease P protein component 3 [Methanobrevibacter sp. DSM 116169]|uniref:ribonuclease P protein component 3 n=1 Tax=Methanobrevibacter sp. DSM 116169 TaxID=3242727 RepID=UPI0038FBE96E
MYFDLNIKGSNLNNDLTLLKKASILGWDYIGLTYNPNNYDGAINYLKDSNYDNFDLRCEIQGNTNQIQKNIQKFRNKSNFISVFGGDLKVNRFACENIKVDILSRPYFKRRDCGINHVLAKAARDNDVAIELCFKDILNSYLSYRSKNISYFKDIIALHRKYDFSLILSSGLNSIYDIRNPKDIFIFYNELGLTNDEISNAIEINPKKILDFNKNRDNLILKGVKKIEGFNDET